MNFQFFLFLNWLFNYCFYEQKAIKLLCFNKVTVDFIIPNYIVSSLVGPVVGVCDWWGCLPSTRLHPFCCPSLISSRRKPYFGLSVSSVQLRRHYSCSPRFPHSDATDKNLTNQKSDIHSHSLLLTTTHPPPFFYPPSLPIVHFLISFSFSRLKSVQENPSSH